MQYKLKIKELSEEPILVRKTNKYTSNLPRLSMDKEGRLVLLTDNMSKYLKANKSLIVFILSALISLTTYGQEFENLAFDDGEVAEWKTFTSASSDNAPDVQGSANTLSLKQLTPGAMVTSTGNIYNPGGVSKFSLTDLMTVII